MIKKNFIIILAVSLLNSCMFSFNNYQNNRTEFKHAPCYEILDEIAYAEQFERDIHKNDKFMFRYMLVLPAIWETYQIIRNEKFIKHRKAELQLAAKAQQCYTSNPIHRVQGVTNTRAYRTKEEHREIQATEDFHNQYHYDPTANMHPHFDNSDRLYKKFEKQMLQY